MVVLLGARQVGKTTLAMQVAQQWRESDPTMPVTIFDLYVVYPGQTRYPLAPNLTALPLTAIADLRLGR